MTPPIGDEKFARAFDISVITTAASLTWKQPSFPHWEFLSPVEVGGHSAGNVAGIQRFLDTPWLTANVNSFCEEYVFLGEDSQTCFLSGNRV